MWKKKILSRQKNFLLPSMGVGVREWREYSWKEKEVRGGAMKR